MRSLTPFPISHPKPRFHLMPLARLWAAALLALLLAGAFFGWSQRAFAQIGNTTLTLIKEATPTDGSDFIVSPALVPVGSFGSNGPDAGKFSVPTDVAVGADGALYVVDSFNHRIQQFGAVGHTVGNFVRMWGKDVDPNQVGTGFEICSSLCGAGSIGGGAGEFNDPTGIAVGHDGAVYVADQNLHARAGADVDGE